MRFNQKLSAGLNKHVHLGQDSDNGKAVVWMVIRLHGMDKSAKTHNTSDAWVGTGLNLLCFITESVQYVKSFGLPPQIRVVWTWHGQVLEGCIACTRAPSRSTTWTLSAATCPAAVILEILIGDLYLYDHRVIFQNI